jgi:hypothetical protein
LLLDPRWQMVKPNWFHACCRTQTCSWFEDARAKAETSTPVKAKLKVHGTAELHAATFDGDFKAALTKAELPTPVKA